MQFNPQLYAMAKNTAATAKNTAATAKQHNKQEKIYRKEDISNNHYKNNNVQGVEWSQFEWKTYETQMTVSMEDTVEIQGISENSVT